jgi:D-alanine-D-alanine ligase
MKVALVHDDVGSGASADDRDVIAQMEAVETALAELGHEFRRVPVTLDLARVAGGLRAAGPDLVFNLAESIAGHGRLIHLTPGLLDALGVPFTGCPTDAVYATSNKLVAKALLRGADVPTPVWLTRAELARDAPIDSGRFIVKSVWEHASRGLDEGSVIDASEPGTLLAALDARAPSLGGEAFAERFVDGREFNVSILAGAVLPCAEITFEGFPAASPRIVGYRAKWDESSHEALGTPRRFDFPEADRALLATLTGLARQCWSLFGCRGYARVDFRVDEQGRPWVLELNTNPCLSPDAGFAAAVARAGLTFTDAVAQIIAATPTGRTSEAPVVTTRASPAARAGARSP